MTNRYSQIMFALIILLFTTFKVNAATAITADELITGLSEPVLVTYAPEDSSRLFIVEQTGKIQIFKNNALNGTAFLDVTAKIANGGEQGLLSLAFHPDYQSNGYFYVNYSKASDGSTIIARYQVSGDPDLADVGSEAVILNIVQPFTNHNGGMISFSPNDGYLYIGMGDGGSGGDPGNRAQNLLEHLGKILRIDVDGAFPYTSPASNPWFGNPGGLDEIWAYGVRNPWRFSFDRLNGDLYIGDVGQNIWEEIDFQSGSSTGGENYGWRLKEATHCYNPSTNCDPASLLDDPVFEYAHDSSRCSITGGFVYRGCAIPDLEGTYFYADFCTGEVWSFKYDGSNITDSTERTAELGFVTINISGFGEDIYGEIYICDYYNGKVHKIIPDGSPSLCLSCCLLRGDVAVPKDGNVLVDDIVWLVNYLFRGGIAPSCLDEGDCSEPLDGSILVNDVVWLVNYLFKGGTIPSLC